MMESLYIDRRDTSLSVESERLIIHHPDMVRAQSVVGTFAVCGDFCQYPIK